MNTRKTLILCKLFFVVGLLLLYASITLIAMDIHKPVMSPGFWITGALLIFSGALLGTTSQFIMSTLLHLSELVTQLSTINETPEYTPNY